MKLLEKYLAALVNLYGIVHYEKILEIYNSQNSEKLEADEIKNIIPKPGEYLDVGVYVYGYGDYFVIEAIALFDDIEEIMAQSEGKPFFIPEKDELLKFADSFYNGPNPHFDALIDFSRRELFPNNLMLAESLAIEAAALFRADASIDIVLELYLKEGLAMKDEGKMGMLLSLMVNLKNNSRIWANRGYTPEELSQKHGGSSLRLSMHPTPDTLDLYSSPRAPVRRTKIPRNAPCPCGSGKKYKHCCLIKEN